MGVSNQQNPPIPGVLIDTRNIRGTTRFSELQQDLQAQIEEYDRTVHEQIMKMNMCAGVLPKHQEELDHIPEGVEFCRRKFLGVESALASDIEAIAHVNKLVGIDAEHAKLSFRVVDNLKLPQQFHTNDAWHSRSTNNRSQPDGEEESRNIVSFVSATADELAATLKKHQNNISEIEFHLRNVEASSAAQINTLIADRNNGRSGGGDDAIQDLAAALTEFEQSILHVAGKVGATREGVQNLQLGAFQETTNGATTNGRRSGIY